MFTNRLKSLNLINKNWTMTVKDIRKQLHKVIENIENKETLKALHYLLAQKLDEERILMEPDFSPNQKKELDKRWREHINGSSKSYDWSNTKKMIRNYGK